MRSRYNAHHDQWGEPGGNRTTPLGGNGMGYPLSKWFVEGVNQAHELGFPFLGDLNFPWLLITTFGTFTF